MWPLLICSIVSVTIMILRGFALRRKIVMPLVIESEIERMTPGESPERLSRLVYHDPSSLARITRVALQHLRGPRSENVEVVQTRARHEMVRLERGLIILEIIVGIAPLLGLIGAVSGLVHVFSHLGLSSGGGGSDTRQIALGIAEALNATVFGLSIAVPTLVGFTYFSRKVEVMSVEMETLVVELINKCYYGHHRLAGRYSHHPADIFCRLHDVQKRSAGGADQFTGIENRAETAVRARSRDREHQSK